MTEPILDASRTPVTEILRDAATVEIRAGPGGRLNTPLRPIGRPRAVVELVAANAKLGGDLSCRCS
jgi:hypothetical protein